MEKKLGRLAVGLVLLSCLPIVADVSPTKRTNRNHPNESSGITVNNLYSSQPRQKESQILNKSDLKFNEDVKGIAPFKSAEINCDLRAYILDINEVLTPGIYSLPSCELQYEIANHMNCGTFADGKYIATLSPTGGAATAYIYDPYSGSLESKLSVDVNSTAVTMAYDAQEHVMYGYFFTNSNNFEFGTIDISTFERTGTIRTVDIAPHAIICTNDGRLLGMWYDGSLKEIDKSTGEETLLSDTGIQTRRLTSGAYDSKHNIMYYASFTDEDKDIYSIDLSNEYSVKKITNGFNYELFGMFVLPSKGNPQAPDPVENLKVEFEGTALTGKISFTMPSTSLDHNELQGELTYNVYANNENILNGSALPGEDVTREITVPGAGQYEFYVKPSNEYGEIDNYYPINLWVGKDCPVMPSSCNISYEDGKVILIWEPVTEGVHSGNFEDNVTYSVEKFINDSSAGIVADGLNETKYEERIAETSGISIIRYSIKAHAGDETSSACESKPLSLGNQELPYIENFDETTALDKFIIEDCNNDGNIWKTNGDDSTGCSVTSSIDMNLDDWLISPGILMEEGKRYEIQINVNATSQHFGFLNINRMELIELRYGTSPWSSEMQLSVLPITSVVGESPITLSAIIDCGATGKYYIGIHGCTENASSKLFLNSLTIQKYTSGVPAGVQNIDFVPDYNGGNSGDISFNAPLLNDGDEPLANLSQIEISRNGEVVKTFENPTPGEELIFRDQTPERGTYTYSFVAINDIGRGQRVEQQIFVGMRIPQGPTDVKVVESADNHGYVTISWTPNNMVEGYPMNPDLISYVIINSKKEQIAELPFAESTFSYQVIGPNTPQTFEYWFIVPKTPMGMVMDFPQQYAMTDPVAIGLPTEMPFNESASNCKLHTNWAQTASGWDIKSSNYKPKCSPVDNDRGMFVFNSPIDSELYSEKILIDDTDNATFSFYYHTTDIESYELMPIVRYNYDIYELLNKWIILCNGEESGWNKVSINLNQFKGKEISIGFKVKSYLNKESLCIDNIRVETMYSTDLCVSDIKGTESVEIGNVGTVQAVVSNEGLSTIDSFDVRLCRNGDIEQTKHFSALKPDSKIPVSFDIEFDLFADSHYIYNIEVECANDEYEPNNISDAVEVIVKQPWLPAVNDLKAEKTEGGASLKWSQPDFVCVPKEFVDDVESYESFAIDDAGDWLFADMDKHNTYSFANSNNSYPGAFKPMAFMVLDTEKLLDYQISLPELAHSGNKSFGCFASDEGQNDDWMVSPELPGTEQYISFYAKTFSNVYANESFEFCYSYGSTDPKDMIVLEVIDAVPYNWTYYGFSVPEGAKRFAIHCTSNDTFIFLVDDISFTRATTDLSLIGYDVYRDQEKIASNIEGGNYTDSFAAIGINNYHVVANYNKGFSGLSNMATIDLSGINEILDENRNEPTYYNLQGIRTRKPQNGIIIKVEDNKSEKILKKD